MMHTRIRAWLIAFTLSAAIAFIVIRLTQEMGSGQASRYEAAARTPWEAVVVPESFRFAIPWLAHQVADLGGMDIPQAYFRIQIVLYASVLASVWVWLRGGLRLSRRVSACVASLFVFSYPGVYNLHNTSHVGFGEHLMLLATFLLLYHGKFIPFLIAVAGSCFVKESIGLVMIPTYLMIELTTRRERRSLVRMAALMALYLTLTAMVSRGYFFQGATDTKLLVNYYSWEYLRAIWQYIGGWSSGLSQVIHTYGPLWGVAALGFVLGGVRERAMGTMQLMACLLPVFACDVSRVVGVGFPAMLLLSSEWLRRMPWKDSLLLAGVCAAYFLAWNHRICYPGVLEGSMLIVILLGARQFPRRRPGVAIQGTAERRTP